MSTFSSGAVFNVNRLDAEGDEASGEATRAYEKTLLTLPDVPLYLYLLLAQARKGADVNLDFVTLLVTPRRDEGIVPFLYP